MSSEIDPLLLEGMLGEGDSSEKAVSSRLGMGNVRQALGRWWLMLIFGVLGYIGALYYLSIQDVSSTATVLIEQDLNEQVLIGSKLESDTADSGVYLGNLLKKLQAPTMLNTIAEHPRIVALNEFVPPSFSLKPKYMRTEEELAYHNAGSETIPDRASRIAGMISMVQSSGSSILELSVTHPDSYTAKVVADVVAEVFIESEETKLIVSSESGYQLLKKEADSSFEKVEKLEASLQQYNTALKLNEQIHVKRDEIIAMRLRYGLKHPNRIDAEVLYVDLLKRFEREIKRAAGTDSELSYWLKYKQRIKELDELRKGGTAEAIDASDEWLALIQNALVSRSNLLGTSLTNQKSLYNSLTLRMEEVDLNDEEKLNDFSILEAAHLTSTVDSVRLIYLAVGSLLGGLVGFGFAFGLAVIDYKIYDVRSAEEATGLTCMAAIPVSSKFGRRTEWDSILNIDPHSANSEAIRNLRASIILLGKPERNKIILVTSALPGEGKTTVSSEMASAFALNKEKTLLMDVDLRRPKLTDSFESLKGKPGIVEVLAGQASLDDVIHESPIKNMDLIGSGDRAPNPSELLNEGEFSKLIESLASRYDRIILDSAPVLPVADSRLLSKHVHAVIMVVRSRKTPVGAITRAHDLLKQAGARVSGVVVNGMKRTSSGSYNGYKGYGEYGAEDYGYYGGEK